MVEDAGARLHGICDVDEKALESWKEEPGLQLYREYTHVLADAAVDAVCIATPVSLHAEQSLAALDAGKHVLSEVPAVDTVEDAKRLIHAVETSKKTFMLAENYCYSRWVLMVQNMVEQGLFGELTFASGAYLHDCRKLFFDSEGELTWRGNRRKHLIGNSYPTHSMGPICRWLGIGRTDSLARIASFQSPSKSIAHYCARNLPDRPEYLEPGFFRSQDSCSSSIFTERGVLIDTRVDWASARPHDMVRYELQGTKASFLMYEGTPLIWIEGRSEADPTGIAKGWDPLEKYADEFEHPLWREFGEEAAKAGHGGGDYFTLKEFVAAIRENRKPEIDVLDAVTWSLVCPLSAESILSGNSPVEFPEFTRVKNP